MQVGRKEPVQLDVLVSLQGLGLSLVNNEWQQEILYMGITGHVVSLIGPIL